MPQTRRTPELRHDHRHDDVEQHREEQRVPRHRNRGEAEQQADDRREGHHHDRVVERHLGEREMRLAIDEVRPYEHHGGARRRREQDEAGDIAVHLIRRQKRAEKMRDEDPGQQRHRERLDEPIDADRGRDAAPVLPHLAQGGEIDLEQHRHDHEPHQHRDRQIDLRHRRIADDMKDAWQQLAERDADDDAERHPEGEEAFEHAHRRFGRRRAVGRSNEIHS